MARDLILGKTNHDWSCGSVLLPAKQEKRILDKVDDVRYDVRQAGRRVGAGVALLSGAVGLLAVSSILRDRGRNKP